MTDTRRFDQIAGTWDADTARVRLAEAVAEAIACQCPLAPTLDVLDFGCGTGLLTFALRPHVRSVTGADTSAGMLGVLEQKVREQATAGIAVQRLRAEDGYAISGQYDLIVSSMTLHHVAELPPLFVQFRDHLRPGGRVALADLDHEDGTFHSADITDVFHQGFERAALKEMLTQAGFVDLADTTAFIHHRHGREYPVFLISGRSGVR